MGSRVLAHAAQRRRVLGRHRLLDPFGLVGLEAYGHRRRGRGREAPVHLDHDLHVGADGVADGRHHRDGGAMIGRRELRGGRAEGVGPDHVAGRELVDAGEQGVGLVDDAHFAGARQALVGRELQEYQLAPRGADHRRARARDLQRGPGAPGGEATASGA